MEDKVADHFFAIIPLFPTPEIIILPFLQFKIVLTIFSNEDPILEFSFLKNLTLV